MLSFQIDTQLTKDLIALNEIILEKHAFLETLPKDEKESIHRYAWISMVGASTRIENAIMTNTEIDWLDSLLEKTGRPTELDEYRVKIQNKLSKDKERSVEEVAGCRSVLLLIYGQAKDYLPLTEFLLRSLHHELLRFYTKPGIKKGQYKDHPNSVIKEDQRTKEKSNVFKTADPGVITEMAMKELVQWYNTAIQQEPWPIAVATEFVYRFLAIHPFQDGNGRLGRALMLMSLLHCRDKKLSSVAYYCAIDRHIERHKQEYYIVLNQCSKGEYKQDPTKYNIRFFLRFMIKILKESMADIDFYSKRAKAYKKLPESALKILSCFKDQAEEKLKTSDFLYKTKLPRRTITHALKILIDKEFITRYGQGTSTFYRLIF